VHLIPADRMDQRIIDGEQVCQAITALGDPASVRVLAQHFAVLADPTRLMLLLCIRAAGPISVSDLAVATGLQDVTVSQALRYLRASQIVTAQRHGRVIRYQLADHPVSTLLADHQAAPSHPAP
jgi:ArsR family transcriptional regulator, lead/cadmium/zinc/bismuth-responsive transcriptional repressor